MKKLIRLLWPGVVALVVVLCVFAFTTSASPAHIGKSPTRANTPDVTVPCGVSSVPFSVYSMAITQTETLALTFNSTDPSGEGLVTLVVNNYSTSYWQRTNANCGTCTLTIPGVTPGNLGTLQVSLTAAAASCPASGVTIGTFNLTVTPDVSAGAH
jgi:hypothetical protein